MTKLKYEMYNKGIELEQQLYNQLENYDSAIVGAVDESLSVLKNEYEELKINSNVIGIDTDMNMYLQNQQRVKELPALIEDTERERLKLIENKKEFRNKLCKGIAAEIDVDYVAEFDDNMKILSNEYNKHLIKIIEIYNQMEQLERDYNAALFETIHTKGVYMTLDKSRFINSVHSEHNIVLNLYGAR